MAIQLNPEQQRVVDEAIHAGLIRNPDDVFELGISTLENRLESRQTSTAALTPDEWVRELHDWVQSHSSSTPVLPDEALNRDSIYKVRY